MRYPLAPLMTAAGVPTMAALRRVCPMNGSEYRRVQEEGLSEAQADRWAVRLGLVPWLVWPDWLEDVAVECADRTCTRRFVPARTNHRYCSARCGSREGARLRREDPEFREQELAANRAYYAQTRRAQAVKKKARYWQDPEAMRAARRERYRKNAEAEKARQRDYNRAKKIVTRIDAHSHGERAAGLTVEAQNPWSGTPETSHIRDGLVA